MHNTHEHNQKIITQSIQTILESLGESVDREGLQKTPERVAKSLLFLTRGHDEEESVIANCKEAVFNEQVTSQICVKNIEFYSLCEHHMLPFWGTVSISFIPHVSGKILGLSKFGRLVDVFSRRLQVQERLGMQLMKALYEILDPRGICIKTEARHMCMMMRGVEKHMSTTVTHEFKGDKKFEEKLINMLN